MPGSFPIARLLGIPIRVNVSWFASLLLVVSILSMQLLPLYAPGSSAAVYWSLGLAGGLVFFMSIVLHELGHSVVARHFGIPVASITLFIFGGVAQITREPERPRVEMLMAVAGPAVSLVLGALFLALRFLVVTSDTPVRQVIEWLGSINILLAAFNMLPGFPMDGGRVLRSAIWMISRNYRMATRVAGWLSHGIAILLMLAGLASIFSVPNWPLGNDPIGGLWLIIVGLFLNRMASQTQTQSRALDVLRGLHAGQVMDSQLPIVPADATIRSILLEQPLDQREPAYFVFNEGRLIGLLSREALLRLPPERWATTPVSEILIPADRIQPASPDEDGVSLMQRMETGGLPALPVTRDGIVVGVVTRANLMDLLGQQGVGRRIRRWGIR